MTLQFFYALEVPIICYVPTPVLRENDLTEEDPDDDPDEPLSDSSEVLVQLLQENNMGEDPSSVESGIAKLSQAGLIEKDLRDRLMCLYRSSFKKIPDSPMPLFEKFDIPLKKGAARKHSPVVEVNRCGKIVFINKTTAVWLLQESESVY